MEEYDNPGEILHSCKICGKEFAGPATLQIHERTHQEDPQDIHNDPQGRFRPKVPVDTDDGFESFKEYMEGIGCDNVELQKAIDTLKLLKEFEESANVITPENNRLNMQPSTSQGIMAAGFTRLVIAEPDSDSENTGLFMTI